MDLWVSLASQPTLLGVLQDNKTIRQKTRWVAPWGQYWAQEWNCSSLSVMNSMLLFPFSAVGVAESLPGELQIFGDDLDTAGSR